MLTNKHTKLRFDGFTSNWVNVDNGIVQGNPPSMLLYLFYNADLIASSQKEEAMIAYIDDASYYVEGLNFEEAYSKLQDMMHRGQGSYNWSKQHNSCFEPSKMALVGFSHKRETDLQHPGRLAPEIRPDLHLCDTVIKPSTAHKCLGVIFNQELRWWKQVGWATATAAK